VINLVRKFWYLMAVALLCFASSAVANTMTLKGTPSGNLGGVYTSPYEFTVNGTPGLLLICDDFSDEITVGETWSFNVNTWSTLSNTLWAAKGAPNLATQYEEATWLALQLLNPSATWNTFCTNAGGFCAGDISYAIWAVFDPAALNNLTPGSADYENALNWVNANASLWDTGGLHGFEILTPACLSNIPSCPGGALPQEFLEFDAAPEASTAALLGPGLFGLLSLIFVSWRKVRTA
jgi:hypothetical protein